MTMISVMLGDPPAAVFRKLATEPVRSVYLPIVHGPDAVDVFYDLLIGDPRQQRPKLALCPALCDAARRRAHGLVTGDPWAHVDAHGVTPNEYARASGCVLPSDYAECGNNIESLVAGSANADMMFAALASSPAHAAHLFGQGWFGRQCHAGIAMAVGGYYGWYWVILIGECVASGE